MLPCQTNGATPSSGRGVDWKPCSGVRYLPCQSTKSSRHSLLQQGVVLEGEVDAVADVLAEPGVDRAGVAAAHHEVDAAVGEVLQHRVVLGDLHRVVRGDERRGRGEQERLGLRGDVGERRRGATTRRTAGCGARRGRRRPARPLRSSWRSSTIALMRSPSLGVRPVVGSWVTSLTVKIPNCISWPPGLLLDFFSMHLHVHRIKPYSGGIYSRVPRSALRRARSAPVPLRAGRSSPVAAASARVASEATSPSRGVPCRPSQTPW